MSPFARRASFLAVGLLLVVLGFALGTAVISSRANPVRFAQQPVIPTAIPDPVTDQERLFADIYSRVSPSVVSISVAGESATGVDFQSGGTGFVLDEAGHIATNNHVVAGADLIEVNFLDGTIVRAEIVGLDPDSDLAVIRVDLPEERLFPVTIGDSSQLFIGETTLAIGSPFGQRWTLTSGIVSALDRTLSGETQFSVGSVIQTDTAINPGNSGGPLLNLQGEVIGVNSQILSGTRSNSGVGFAIPSNLVQRVLADLIARGRVEYSYLGIRGGSELNLATIEALGLPNNLRGVLVSSVFNNGPADGAGIRNATGETVRYGFRVPTQADIITAINGTPVDSMSGLITYLAINTRPGDTVSVTLWRGGEQITLPLQLQARPTN